MVYTSGLFSHEEQREIWEQFFGRYGYKPRISQAAHAYPMERSLEVEYHKLDYFNRDFASFLLDRPEECLKNGEEAIQSILAEDERVPLHIRIKDLPHDITRIEIRDLRSEHLGKFISVEGLSRKSTEVRPRMVRAVFQCGRCGFINMVEQEEELLREPAECSKQAGGCGKTKNDTWFRILIEDSRFKDTQKLEIQESPEGLRGGDQPQRLVAYVEEDLTGHVSPGDRVNLNGVLKAKFRRLGGNRSTILDIFLEVNSVEWADEDYEEIDITPEEQEEIQQLAENPEIDKKIISSIAPSIYGMVTEKEVIALQLFGGVSKRMSDGTRIRGDIHVLLVGDPGTAKSQLLRYVSEIAPRAVFASGQSATKAGLTATAVRDEFGEGRWTLEAGALVLADRGMACIDELDKMNSEDRSAMHEAMEQQRISVAKAGITATLQSRCSLLAAANPKVGKFEEYTPIPKQINMPASLLSRFDVIFPIMDKPEEKLDSALAEHILLVHRTGERSSSREMSGEGTWESRFKEEDPLKPPIDPKFMRKYISYAKTNCSPVLTDEAISQIRNTYVEMRSQSAGENVVPITARQLEAFIRLSEASARMRLSNIVELSDAERACRIINDYLGKVARDEKGFIDYNRIASGTTMSQLEKRKAVLVTIRELEGEIEDRMAGVPEKRIYARLKEEKKMTSGDIKYYLDMLTRGGDIIQPQAGENPTYKIT